VHANFDLKVDEKNFFDDTDEVDRFISEVDLEKAKASGDWSVIKEQMRRYVERSISVECGNTSDEVKPVCVDLEVKSLVPVLICPLKITLDLPVMISVPVLDCPVKFALDLPVLVLVPVLESPVEFILILPTIRAVPVWSVPVVPDVVFEMSPAFIVRECVDVIKDDNLEECVDVTKDDNLEVCVDVIKDDNLIEVVDVLSDDNVMMEINDEVMDDKKLVEMTNDDKVMVYKDDKRMDVFICDTMMVDGFSWMDFPTPPEIFCDVVWFYLCFALVGIG